MTEEGTFPPLLDHFEQFLALFENLKEVAGEPTRLGTFYSQSSAIRDVAEKLEKSAGELTYNLEWFGAKRLGPVKSRFVQAWAEYQDQWRPVIRWCSVGVQTGKPTPFTPEIQAVFKQFSENERRNREQPDPESDEFFDPVRHDGGDALALGVDYWRGEVHRAKLSPTSARSRSTRSTT